MGIGGTFSEKIVKFPNMIDRKEAAGGPTYLEPLAVNKTLPADQPITRKTGQGIRIGHPAQSGSVRLMISKYQQREEKILLDVQEKKNGEVLEKQFPVRTGVTYRLNGTPYFFNIGTGIQKGKEAQFVFLTEAPQGIIVGKTESGVFNRKPKEVKPKKQKTEAQIKRSKKASEYQPKFPDYKTDPQTYVTNIMKYINSAVSPGSLIPAWADLRNHIQWAKKTADQREKLELDLLKDRVLARLAYLRNQGDGRIKIASYENKGKYMWAFIINRNRNQPFIIKVPEESIHQQVSSKVTEFDEVPDGINLNAK